MPKRKATEDENGNQEERVETEMNRWLNSEVKRVCDMRRHNDNVEFLVEYKDSSECHWLPIHIVKRNHPQKVIEFYERCISWN